MNFKPLGDRLVVAREAEPTVSAGGIIIPDSAQEKPLRGRVIAVGPGKTGEDGSIRPVDVAVGDLVLFGKYAGTEIKIAGEERTLLREEDVLGIIED